MSEANPKRPKLQLVTESPREFFVDRVDQALEHLKFSPQDSSRVYLINLLQHFMFATNLFPPDGETGKSKRDTLAEMYLRAQNASSPAREELLKRLGDSSLYISGFFGDSLNRKIVDIDYYVDMGGVAYAALAVARSKEPLGEVFDEFSHHFSEFVDVLTLISQEAMIQSNEDLLRLYDRYMSTGSRLAEEQLLEKGLLTPELSKVKTHKM